MLSRGVLGMHRSLPRYASLTAHDAILKTHASHSSAAPRVWQRSKGKTLLTMKKMNLDGCEMYTLTMREYQDQKSERDLRVKYCASPIRYHSMRILRRIAKFRSFNIAVFLPLLPVQMFV